MSHLPQASEKAAKLALENGGVRTSAYDAATFRSLALSPYRRRAAGDLVTWLG